ncbi:MAG: hypothetical protein KJ970_20670 [Candidatus Eisenbacteria bacterium]|uniref:6-bladed beta-propeller n=1 Tax=Eiseniibacteriota bacterium TaxID=2212470 RepID=A0A948W8H6_UNCEI|nr:hypothetical protein [Candidatus Eisenbacteria bacterium]
MIVLFLGSAFGPADAADVPRSLDDDGPTHGVQPLALHELWRVGGENEDIMFGRITDLKMHPDGSLFVLDNQLCQVVVISADGEHLRDISREGDGPGEVRQPMGLVFLADDVLGIGTGFPAKLITLRLDGTPIGTHYPVGAPAEGNVAVMISLHCVDGVLAASGGKIAFVTGGESYTDRFVSVGDASICEFHKILEITTPFDPSGYIFVEADDYYIDRSWVLGSGGRIYAPMKRDAYEISEYDTAGNLVRVFGRRYEPRKRTQAEKGRVSPVIDPGTPANTDWTIEDHDPCVARIMTNPDDETIWVLTPHGHEDQPEGILETWDVFAPDGEYLTQVPIPLGHEMNEGTCYLVGNRRMVVVRGTGSVFNPREADEETEIEPLEVICYEIR